MMTKKNKVKTLRMEKSFPGFFLYGILFFGAVWFMGKDLKGMSFGKNDNRVEQGVKESKNFLEEDPILCSVFHFTG